MDSSDFYVKEAEKTKAKLPSLYKVLLYNDDYTPMGFVVEILQRLFFMDLEKATQLMLTVHYKGKTICGIYTSEVAEMKVAQVMMYAKEHQYPLLCTMEKA
ncbi:ATP-dependent Clp protease adaptor protein ClpS [Candidatus Enterovibrio altilux]|uniref:ATP-dependent Clp protease adapter protein ClpS n=1 Tax=Candidatus Enterovibrio altilux TaxID=1927128 RepID=A0A291B6W3_9GAMM|nr:ATP-dependent Clp protease adapter ClpS [Candidatus Enterovibrio luxaltus]ATF08742.1 ATP-dependent Clp protease adaptor protein ClpS [Candidatus Enterovibrio luxaltus]